MKNLTKPVPERGEGAMLKRRQREVEQRLALFGLKPGPRRLVPNEVRTDEICRLRKALESLGPVFTSFGLYLSTRIDLLSVEDCCELAKLPNRGQPRPPAVIQNLIKEELGRQPEELFSDFEDTPFLAGLLFQQHRAWLLNGEAVTVRFINPDLDELLEYDTCLLPRLTSVFISRDCNQLQIEGAIDDFILSLQQSADLALYSNALRTLSDDAESFEMLRVPHVYEELSTPRLITIERLPGQTVEEMLASDPANSKEATLVDEEECYGLALRICIAWLRQTLRGGTFPLEPHAENITILPNNQIAFTEGALAGLPFEAKPIIWSYLLALVSDNPDQACSALLKASARDTRSVSADELRQRFRQLAPFRDGEWTVEGDQHNLAEYVFLHWKLTSRSGYLPRGHMLPFYRGLLTADGLSRRLAPRRDALREAFQQVRLLDGMERFRSVFSADEMNEQINKYLEVMMELPRTLDDALSRGAEWSESHRTGMQQAANVTRRKQSGIITAATLLTMASVAMLSHRLAGSVFGSWGEGLTVTLFSLFGFALLRIANRD